MPYQSRLYQALYWCCGDDVMSNILLKIEYDGTAYGGWQIQPNAITVQEVIENAIFDLTKSKVRLNASGRTDAGVHATGQYANFFIDSTIPSDKFAQAVNTRLPDDIRIIKSMHAADDFHARFSAIGKHYRYQMHIGVMAVGRKYYHVLRHDVDINVMQKAAAYLIGEHDFKSFMASGSSVKTTVREIYRADIKRSGDIIILDIECSGFLYNMVRIIAGTLIEIGQGRINPEMMKDIILSKNRERAGKTAPAKGLLLIDVKYKV